jgi:hypothetical protein
LIEEQVDATGLESGKSGERGSGGAGELGRVEIGGALWVNGIEVDMVEGGGRQGCLRNGGRGQAQSEQESGKSQPA